MWLPLLYIERVDLSLQADTAKFPFSQWCFRSYWCLLNSDLLHVLLWMDLNLRGTGSSRRLNALIHFKFQIELIHICLQFVSAQSQSRRWLFMFRFIILHHMFLTLCLFVSQSDKFSSIFKPQDCWKGFCEYKYVVNLLCWSSHFPLFPFYKRFLCTDGWNVRQASCSSSYTGTVATDSRCGWLEWWNHRCWDGGRRRWRWRWIIIEPRRDSRWMSERVPKFLSIRNKSAIRGEFW